MIGNVRHQMNYYMQSCTHLNYNCVSIFSFGNVHIIIIIIIIIIAVRDVHFSLCRFQLLFVFESYQKQDI